MVEKVKTKGEEILDKPLPRMMDDIWEALEETRRAEREAKEAAREAKKAAQEEAAKAAEAAKAEVKAELVPQINALEKAHRDLSVDVARLLSIFELIAGIQLEDGKAHKGWGEQIIDLIAKTKIKMGLTP
jgi:seryl-tRNA synthetase